MLNIKGYIFLVRTVTLTFPVHELSALDWSEKWFLTCSSFTIWSIWMKLHRYVDHQRLHIVTKDVISLSISVLLLFRHYISHKITFGAPSSGGVLCSACGAFIRYRISKVQDFLILNFHRCICCFNLVEYKNQCLGKIAMQKYSSTDAIPDMFIKVNIIK